MMLLVVNAGSSSLKVALFDGGVQVRSGQVGEIGTDGHRAALERLLTAGFGQGLTAGAHRVVHGGAGLTATCRIDAGAVSYTHLRVHETKAKLVYRLLFEQNKK